MVTDFGIWRGGAWSDGRDVRGTGKGSRVVQCSCKGREETDPRHARTRGSLGWHREDRISSGIGDGLDSACCVASAGFPLLALGNLDLVGT